MIQPSYTYAAANYSKSYVASGSPNMTRDDNPYVNHEILTNASADPAVLRELVYVRAIDTMVIVDRLRAVNSSVTMAFLAHATSWSVSGTTARATKGASELVLKTLRPTTATRRVVTEGGAAGQARLQVEQVGLATHFLHVVQAKASGRQM